jgi:hypothetical protein
MNAIEILIADSLADSISRHTFDGAISKVTAVRRFVPDFQGEDVSTLKVSVVPGECEISNHTHGADLFESSIHVVIAKRIEDDTDIDDLVDLRTGISDAIRSKTLPASVPAMPSGVVWVSIANTVTFQPDQLTNHRVFMGEITVAYRRAQAKVTA